MALTSGDIAVGRLVFRLWALNEQHAIVDVFDQGASAGRLTLSRAAWLAILASADREPTGEGIPMALVPLHRPLAESEGESGKLSSFWVIEERDDGS